MSDARLEIDSIKEQILNITTQMNDLTLPMNEVNKLVKVYWELKDRYNVLHRSNNIPNICKWGSYTYDRNEFPHVTTDGRPYRHEIGNQYGGFETVYFNPIEVK